MKEKKKSFIYELAFMGIMTAINIVLLTLGMYFFPIQIALVIILPCGSTLVAYKCDLKHYPIYLISNLALGCLILMGFIDSVLLYLLPSLISGFIFGFSFKKHLGNILTILLAALSNLFITVLIIYLTGLLFQIDLIINIAILFKIESNEYYKEILSVIFSILSLAETYITYLIIKEDAKKFDIEIEDKTSPKITLISCLIISCLIALFSFFKLTLFLSLILLVYNIVVSIPSLIKLIKEKSLKTYLTLAVLILANILIIAILFPLIKMPLGFLLINNYSLSIVIFFFIKNIALDKKTNVK